MEGQVRMRNARPMLRNRRRLRHKTMKGECKLCYASETKLHSLSCEDFFCQSCISLLLNHYLSEGIISDEEMVCPSCSSTIQNQDMKSYLNKREYSKLKSLRDKYKADKLVVEGRAEYCPLPDCVGYVHVINGQIGPACTVCRATICTSCKKCTHPSLTCQEYALKNDTTEDLALSRDWKRCPYCYCLVEKSDRGCNFLKCTSNACKGTGRALCYLCGKGLDRSQHFSHYQNTGPFGDSCNSLDGIQDKSLEDSARGKEIKLQEPIQHELLSPIREQIIDISDLEEFILLEEPPNYKPIE